MGVFVLLLHFVALAWGKNDPGLTTLGNFILHPMAALMIVALLGVAITGGMFVVPLYAFLTTTVPKTETSRTVAANNIVNSGAMVIGSLIAIGLNSIGVGPSGQLLLVAAMCLVVGVARVEAPPRLRLSRAQPIRIETNRNPARNVAAKSLISPAMLDASGEAFSSSRAPARVRSASDAERRPVGQSCMAKSLTRHLPCQKPDASASGSRRPVAGRVVEVTQEQFSRSVPCGRSGRSSANASGKQFARLFGLHRFPKYQPCPISQPSRTTAL